LPSFNRSKDLVVKPRKITSNGKTTPTAKDETIIMIDLSFIFNTINIHMFRTLSFLNPSSIGGNYNKLLREVMNLDQVSTSLG